MNEWDPNQWSMFFAALGVLSTTLVGGILKVIITLKDVSHQVTALEIKVDGRLTQLLERTAIASNLEGQETGRKEKGSATAPKVRAAVETDEDGTLIVTLPIPVPPILLVPDEDEEQAAAEGERNARGTDVQDMD